MNVKIAREKAVRDVKCNLILDAARRMFSKHGFFKTRLEDIASAAGFSKASLYNYYKDKEEIFINLAIREHERLLERMKNDIPLNISFMKNLEMMLRAIFEVYGEHYAFFLSSFNIEGSCDDSSGNFLKHHVQAFRQFRELTKQMIDIAASHIKEARNRGEIKSKLPDRVLATYLASLIRGVFLEWKFSGRIGNKEVEIARILEFVSKGLDVKIDK